MLCTHAGSTCEFTAAYTRGRLPSVPTEDIVHSDTNGIQQITLNTDQVIDAFGADRLTLPLDQTVDQQVSASDPDMNDLLHPSTAVMGNSQLPMTDRADSRLQSSRNSPEPSQTDLQGHYVGPSSGVSFLLRVQKKLHRKVSFSQDSSIFTFGDAPLPAFDPSFFVLPPKADAEKLVARYFDYAVATHRFLHRPTVEAWFEEFYANLGVMRQKEGARERTALLFMVFAVAREYLPDVIGPNGVDQR